MEQRELTEKVNQSEHENRQTLGRENERRWAVYASVPLSPPPSPLLHSPLGVFLCVAQSYLTWRSSFLYLPIVAGTTGVCHPVWLKQIILIKRLQILVCNVAIVIPAAAVLNITVTHLVLREPRSHCGLLSSRSRGGHKDQVYPATHRRLAFTAEGTGWGHSRLTTPHPSSLSPVTGTVIGCPGKFCCCLLIDFGMVPPGSNGQSPVTALPRPFPLSSGEIIL